MSTITTYRVEGMTCGHCVDAVRAELSALPGVLGVGIDLIDGAPSTVSVTSGAPLSRTEVAAAIDEAGYSLAAGP